MARKTRRKRQLPRLGKLLPQYNFFLNPYTDVRFTTSCPGCSGKTKQRKLPLAIHVDGWGMVILNKTCRFCPYCDLLIAHQNEIEAQLAHVLPQVAPHALRNNYLIMGTIERKDWRRGLTDPLSSKEMIEALHDFKDHLHFKPAPLWTYAGPRDGPARPR
jgi:hypothetical protein